MSPARLTLSKAIHTLFCLVAFALPLEGFADDWSFAASRQGWGHFALGFASGIAVHELGHYVVATSKGYQVSHDGVSIVYPGARFTPADRLQVASAGFQAQWIMSELVFRDSHGEEIKTPPGDFDAGLVSAHLGITFAYLVYLKDHKLGDITGMAEATGRSRNQIAFALAIPGALDAWRLFGHDVPGWVPGLSLFSKGIGLGWVWSY